MSQRPGLGVARHPPSLVSRVGPGLLGGAAHIQVRKKVSKLTFFFSPGQTLACPVGLGSPPSYPPQELVQRKVIKGHRCSWGRLPSLSKRQCAANPALHGNRADGPVLPPGRAGAFHSGCFLGSEPSLLGTSAGLFHTLLTFCFHLTYHPPVKVVSF